jgi:hypothetical protein
VRRLLDAAEIEPAGPRRYRVVDPLFSEWIGAMDAGTPDAETADGT